MAPKALRPVVLVLLAPSSEAGEFKGPKLNEKFWVVKKVGDAVRRYGLRNVGILETKSVMEDRFYRERLERKFGLKVLLPDDEDREKVHRIICGELWRGKIKEELHRSYIRIVERLTEGGAEGIILGCTEITLLLKPGDVALPVFDTTRLHAEVAVDLALKSWQAGRHKGFVAWPEELSDDLHHEQPPLR